MSVLCYFNADLYAIFSLFHKNKIAVLIVIYWSIVCEIIKDTTGESQLDKL